MYFKSEGTGYSRVFAKNVRYGPVLSDGRRAVHWLVGDEKEKYPWKHVGWLMPGVNEK